MTTKISLQIVGRDLFDDTTDETISSIFDHAVVVTMRGRTQIFSVFVDDDEVVEMAVETARKIEQYVTGARIDGVERDPVTVTDIANRVGVSRETARKWASLHNFPTADGFLESSSMEYWSWVKVSDWLLQERAIDMGDTLPSLAQLAQIEYSLARDAGAEEVQWHNVSRRHPTVFATSEQSITSDTVTRSTHHR